jgi:hypothetical protein
VGYDLCISDEMALLKRGMGGKVSERLQLMRLCNVTENDYVDRPLIGCAGQKITISVLIIEPRFQSSRDIAKSFKTRRVRRVIGSRAFIAWVSRIPRLLASYLNCVPPITTPDLD